jgi:TetR/AcrR family transcriptional regulator
MEDQKLPRREREKLRQRQEMLATALDLFSRKGYHNVSMQEIAQKAEFAIGTLYKFFQNKEDLYKALVLELCDEFEDSIMRAIEQPQDEVEKLRSYVRAKTEVFHRNLPFIRLYLAESRGASFNLKAGLDDEIRKRYYFSLESIAAIFASGIKNQRFKKIADPYYLGVALSSVIDAFLLLWLDAPESHLYPEDPDAILNIFFKGLINP